MADIEVTTRPSGVTGSPGPAPERPRIELILTPETGAETVRAEGSKTPDRAQVIARAKARAAGGEKPAGKAAAKAEPEGTGAEGDSETTTDDSVDTAAETETEVDDSDDTAAEAEPEAAEEPAAAAPAAAEDDDQLLHANLESQRLARDVDQLRSQLDSYESGLLGDEAREAYFEDPAGYIRGHLSSMFGLDQKDAKATKLLLEEMHGLITDLTVELSGAGISAEKIAQIQTMRVGRHSALQTRARQATKQSGSKRADDSAAEGYVSDVFLKAAGSKFPHLALATDLDGITPARALIDTLRRATARGDIKTEGRAVDVVLAEAARLADHSYAARADRISARRDGFKKAAPKPVAGKPAPVAAQPGQPKPADKPKPRTLSASEAGTPAPKPKPAPKGPREVVIVRDPDRADRDRRGLIDRYKAMQQRK